MLTAPVITSLQQHRAHDAMEARHREALIAFVTRLPDAWWKRATLEGHVTASAFLVNAHRTHALLLHHAKLGRWLQPGGHIDDTDATPLAAALREAREETGLDHLVPAREALFDVDVHDIPARRDEPAHLHYDLRYLIIAHDDGHRISAESLDARWIAIPELLLPGVERSIARMAEKSREAP